MTVPAALGLVTGTVAMFACTMGLQAFLRMLKKAGQGGSNLTI